MTGRTSPKKGIYAKRTEIACPVCGKLFLIRDCYLKRSQKHFCSNECKSVGMSGSGNPFYKKRHSDYTKDHWSISRKGENNHAWKGGISFEPYCPKFDNEFKERVRAFFGYTCQMCGHVWIEGEEKLAVHHVNYNEMVCCNSIETPFICFSYS